MLSNFTHRLCVMINMKRLSFMNMLHLRGVCIQWHVKGRQLVQCIFVNSPSTESCAAVKLSVRSISWSCTWFGVTGTQWATVWATGRAKIRVHLVEVVPHLWDIISAAGDFGCVSCWRSTHGCSIAEHRWIEATPIRREGRATTRQCTIAVPGGGSFTTVIIITRFTRCSSLRCPTHHTTAITQTWTLWSAAHVTPAATAATTIRTSVPTKGWPPSVTDGAASSTATTTKTTLTAKSTRAKATKPKSTGAKAAETHPTKAKARTEAAKPGAKAVTTRAKPHEWAKISASSFAAASTWKQITKGKFIRKQGRQSRGGVGDLSYCLPLPESLPKPLPIPPPKKPAPGQLPMKPGEPKHIIGDEKYENHNFLRGQSTAYQNQVVGGSWNIWLFPLQDLHSIFLPLGSPLSQLFLTNDLLFNIFWEACSQFLGFIRGTIHQRCSTRGYSYQSFHSQEC